MAWTAAGPALVRLPRPRHRHDRDRARDDSDRGSQDDGVALFGWHPEPIRRLRSGFLVGIGGMSTTDEIWNFIPALGATDGGDRTESSMAVSAGLDGAIAFTRRLALVPQVRVHRPFALPFLVGREATYRLQVALR
jgi:hypothetical protein